MFVNLYVYDVCTENVYRLLCTLYTAQNTNFILHAMYIIHKMYNVVQCTSTTLCREHGRFFIKDVLIQFML